MPADPAFIDTNVLIYSLGDEKEIGPKKAQATALLCQTPFISTQVLNECSNVLRRKFNQDYREIQETLEFTLQITQCIEITLDTVRSVWFLGEKYRFNAVSWAKCRYEAQQDAPKISK